MLVLSVFGKSHPEVFYSGKMDIEVIQNSILNNIMVLAFVLEFFHEIVCI